MNKTVSEMLDQYGARIINEKSSKGYIAIVMAAVRHGTDMLTLLLDRGADINIQDVDGDTALIMAAGSNLSQSVELLLKRGADMDLQNDSEETALMLAEKWRNADTVAVLKGWPEMKRKMEEEKRKAEQEREAAALFEIRLAKLKSQARKTAVIRKHP